MSERLKPLFEDASAPDTLREFAASARADGANQADLDRLAARVAAQLDIAGIVAPMATTLGSAPRDVPPAPDAQLGAHAALLRRHMRSTRARVAAAVGVSAAIGIGLWSAQRSPADAPPANAPIATAAPTPVPESRPIEPKPDVSRLALPSAATVNEGENTAVEAGEGPTHQVQTRTRHSRAARHARAEPKVSPPSAPAESRASELALIQQAEAARSNSDEALSLLARHEQLYPRGALAQEREVLAIEVLLRAGQLEQASARASRFATAYPDSAHLPRVHALISRADGE